MESEGGVLRREFGEIQQQYAELVEEYKRVCDGISRKEYEGKYAQMTLRGLSDLPSNTTVYRTIGKAFIKSEINSVRERLERVEKNAVVEKESLILKKEPLEKSIEKTEAKAKELYIEMQKTN